jgi:hypothetical protein
MLVLLEGLPGAGKSTNSGLLNRQFERNGIFSSWIHEMLRLHPVLFFNEACLTYSEYEEWCKSYDSGRMMDTIALKRGSLVGIDLLKVEWHYQDLFSEEAIRSLKEKDAWNFSLNRYMEAALEKWREFAHEAAKHPEKVYILDSCIFQYQVFCFQLEDAPKEELFTFIRTLWDIVSDLYPHLVYLYRESIEDQFQHIKKVRGDQFFQSMWERDRHNPYYTNRTYSVEAYYEFLRDYDRIVRELFKEAPCPKVSLEITEGEWDKYKAELLQFLNINEHPEPSFVFPCGTFRNVDLGLSMKIEEYDGGYQLIDPTGVARWLYARSKTEWYVQDYPVILILKNKNQIVIGGGNLTNRWTESGLVFDRITT